MGEIVALRDREGPLSNAERQRRYRERRRNALRTEPTAVTRNGERDVTAVTRHEPVTGVTVSTVTIVEIVGRFEAGYVTPWDVTMAARLLMTLVRMTPADGSVTVWPGVTGTVTPESDDERNA